MFDAYSSLFSNIRTSVNVASFGLCSMPNAHSSLHDYL
jgi:hypothetical protein